MVGDAAAVSEAQAGPAAKPAQKVFRVRRNYNRWVADQTLEDFALRFTAKGARRWSGARVANTALGAISFLALEAIGGAITINYGFTNAAIAMAVVCSLIFLTGLPISYYAAKYGVDIDLLTRGAGFGYIGSTVTSLIYASFTFIFFALEGAILAMALQALFGVPVVLGYLVSSLLVIPLVTHGITFISRFQLWSQPLWIVLQLLPFVFILLEDIAAVDNWMQYEGIQAGGEKGFNVLLFGAASSVVFSLMAQIGEQVDFLRFIPPPKPGRRLHWLMATMAAGPGWILIGAAKMMAGSFLALLAIGHGVAPELAADPTRMYTVAFGYITSSPQAALVLAGIFVIICQLKINVTNAYAGSIAWSNFFSRLTHSHPGRVVWLVFNVTIAWLLMELGVYHALEEILGIYALVAVAWVGTIVADLVINKPLGLSPRHIEFKRAHLYDINPVGVGAMTAATLLALAAHFGLFGETSSYLAPYVALVSTLLLAPTIAWYTRGRYYIARAPDVLAGDGASLACCICEHHFETEDMSHCPAYGGAICSLCCTLDARCQDRCKISARLSDQLMGLLGAFLPQHLVQRLRSRFGHFLGLFVIINGASGVLLGLIHRQIAGSDPVLQAAIATTLWQVFFIILIITGVIAWLFVLAHESHIVAQEEAQRQTLLLVEEIAAHQRTDLALQQAKEVAESANQAKSRYLTGISHELRSPLNVVLGYAQLLDRDPSIPEHRREAIGVIRRSGEHLADLIEGLLDISKIEAGRLDLHRDQVRIGELIDQLVYMFRLQAQNKGIGFEYRQETPLPEYVITDEKRLRQILINLLSNAIKFTERGGVFLGVRYRSQVAEFTVRDTGVGIAEGDMERIFRPFERVRKPGVPVVPGTGLGLTITRLLTDVMGGDISVESAPGQGSTFVLTMMLSSVSKPKQAPKLERRVMGYEGPRRTILLVDDDPSHRGLVSEMLVPLGFTVLEAQDGIACQEILGHCRPDLFLLDIELPGANGWDVAAQIRESGHGAPIIMVSADAREGQRLVESQSLHADYLVKPVRIGSLLERIGIQLDLSWRYAPRAVEADTVPSRAFTPGDLPDPQARRELTRMAQLGHVSGLRTRLQALEGSGALDADLAKALHRMVKAYRFDQIIETLGRLG